MPFPMQDSNIQLRPGIGGSCGCERKRGGEEPTAS